MKRMLAVLVILFAGRAFVQAPNVTVTLRHATILPGVPFDIDVDLSNPSDRAVTFGAYALLFTKSADGRIASDHRYARLATRASDTLIVVDPGQTKHAWLTWDENWFSDDAELTRPGTYDIWLELTGAKDELTGITNYVGTIKSGTVRLVRVEPKREDADVWMCMQETASGRWPSNGWGTRSAQLLVSSIVSEHPNSAYFPYALLFAASDDFERVANAVGRFRESPAYPYLLVHGAWMAEYKAKMLIQRGGLQKDIESYLSIAEDMSRAALASKVAAVGERAEVVGAAARAARESLRSNNNRTK